MSFNVLDFHKNKNLENYLSKLVINISDYELSESEISLLRKGTTFVPTPPKPIMSALYHDLSDFFRRLRLKLHFSNTEKQDLNFDEKLESIFRIKSTWTPSPGEDPCLDAYIHCVTEKFLKSKLETSHEENLTNHEKKALINLSNNRDIIIKKADKGSATVIINTSDYQKMVQVHLDNGNFYCQTKNDLTEHHNNVVNKKLNSMLIKGEISEKIYRGLTNGKPKTAQIYVLPKVHKNKNNGLYPSRPIISGIGNATEKISHFVDEHIKPFVPQIPSYIKDTTDFINKIESINDLPDRFYLVTLDVTSLYTNIPNQEGILAVAKTLVKYQPNYSASNSSILELLKIVLHSNNFDFNGKHYLQTGGTAMGTRLAPSYANIFMGDLEGKLLNKSSHKPHTYKRFIDDIFLIWTHSLRLLEEFIDTMNNSHKTIKFTSEISESEIAFLDTTVFRIEGTNRLAVKLYTKPTDTHAYLTYTSCHPKKMKDANPYGQFLRLKRNCTNNTDFEKNALKTKEHYLKRGYPEQLLEDHLQKARSRKRKEVLNKKDSKQESSRVPLVTTYNPSNPRLKDIILDNWKMLQHSEECKKLFSEPPIFAYRRERNLRDMLIHSKFSTENVTNHDTRFTQRICERRNCKYCNILDTKTHFSSNTTGATFKKKCKYDCETSNVIYLINCTKCHKQYVGQSKRSFRKRMYEHMRYIKENIDQPTGKHFNLPEHRPSHAQFEIIEVIKSDPDDPRTADLRNKLEQSWIMKLRTIRPRGINLQLTR